MCNNDFSSGIKDRKVRNGTLSSIPYSCKHSETRLARYTPVWDFEALLPHKNDVTIREQQIDIDIPEEVQDKRLDLSNINPVNGNAKK